MFSSIFQLEIDNKMIRQTGVFTRKSAAIRNIENATWRNWPNGGSLKLHSTDSRMSIELQTVKREHRDQLIQLLRSAVPAKKQTNWDSFILNPENLSERRSLSPFWVAMMFYAFAFSFVCAWGCGLGAVNLFVAAVNAGFATYILARKS